MTQSRDPYSALRFTFFRRFLIASSLVRVGTAAQSLAIGWEIYDRTNHALSLGMVGLVQAVPMLLLTLPAGYLADVFNRRKLMILSLSGATLTSIGLALISGYQASIIWMYLLLFIDSAFLRLGWPAAISITPLLVPPSIFENATKWRVSAMQFTGIAGPAFGGFLISLNLQAAYLISALSSASFVIFLTTVRLPPAPQAEKGNMVGKMLEGINFVRRRKLILGAISLDLFAVLLGGAIYLLPIFGKDIIELGQLGLEPEEALGWLRAAPAAGALVTAILIAHLPPFRHSGKVLLYCVAGFGVATIGFGLSENFWISLVMLGLVGAFDNVSMVIRHVVTQMATPNQMRGRVSAVNSIFVGSSNELGGFESGVVAQIFSPVISVISGGIGTLIVVATWAKIFPDLRKLGRLSSLAPHRNSPT